MTHFRNESTGIIKYIEIILESGMKLGGVVFGIISAWLIWGMVGGAFSGIEILSQADYYRIFTNVVKAGEYLTISGVVVIACVAARYYSDETIGYVLVICGAALHWGMPLAANDTSEQLKPIITYIMSQFGMVGTIALITAVPFFIISLWSRVKADKVMAKKNARCAEGTSTKSDEVKKDALIYFNCWQTPFCRDYMIDFCDAYKSKKSCWRIHSGCYCDENIIIRTLENKGDIKSSSLSKEFKMFKATAKNLSWMEKRDKCAKCGMYVDHQKQKYQLVVPLGFLFPLAIIWSYYDIISASLKKLLVYTDKFSDMVSFGAKRPEDTTGIAQFLGASGLVETILLLCIGLLMVTFFLRIIEYLIFELGM
ncbi:MAG: hypothetical protein ACYC27_15850 [Armatimonadota bacterium]